MTNWLPSLNSLRAFEVVSRHLNYHSAAAELNVTPAAVKQLVSKLEESVGTKLLERKGQGLALTAKGKASCSDLSTAMARLSSSVETMRREDGQQQLIVTVETSFATAWLVPKLDRFRSKFPQISVLIDSNQQIVELEKGHADVAIRYGVETPGEVFVHRLFDDQIFPACSPAMAAGSPGIRKLDDLCRNPLIHWDLSQIGWAQATRKWFMWNKWLSRVGRGEIKSDGGLHFSDYGLAVQAAIAGQGVVLASWPILKEPIESGLLVCPFEERVRTDIGYDLVTTFQAQQRLEVRAFVDWLIETASAE